MAVVLNLKIDQGTDWSAIVTIDKEDGQLFDFSGLNVISQMSRSFYSLTKHTIGAEIYGDPRNGQLRLFTTPEMTQDLRPATYVYDVLVYGSSNGDDKRVLNGNVYLTPQVSRIPT